MRVLVISEDVAERLRATSALTLHGGAEVIEAHTASEGRQVLAADQAFDVLVVDGDLYPSGGFALLYALRQQAQLEAIPTLPAVVLADREQDRWLADWAGANAVLVKPVGPFALASEVRALVGQVGAAHGALESADQVKDLVTAHERGVEAGLDPL